MEIAGDELRFAPHETADFLKLGLFFTVKGMGVFAVSIKLYMGATKI